MLKFVLPLICVATVAMGSMASTKRILRDMSKFNNDVMCWGLDNAIQYYNKIEKACEQCMEFGSNPYHQLQDTFQTLPQSINRGNSMNHVIHKREIREEEIGGGLLGMDETDVEEFLEDFEDFKDSMGTKLSNLTCVLSKMGKLDSNFQVNLDLYTREKWERMDLSKTLAGSDPVWRNGLIRSYSDCHQIAQNWPKESLDRNPISKIFGRHMIFFKCAKKAEEKACSAAQANMWMELAYGKEDGSVDWTKFGLPANKYELSSLATLVMYDTMSDEETFVGDFFSSKGEH